MKRIPRLLYHGSNLLHPHLNWVIFDCTESRVGLEGFLGCQCNSLLTPSGYNFPLVTQIISIPSSLQYKLCMRDEHFQLNTRSYPAMMWQWINSELKQNHFLSESRQRKTVVFLFAPNFRMKSVSMLHKCTAKETKGAFHLSELTGKTIPVVMRISLLIKPIQRDQSNPE